MLGKSVGAAMLWWSFHLDFQGWEAHAESEGRSNSITLCVRYKSVEPMMNTDAMQGMMMVSHGQHFKDKKFQMTA